MLFSTTPFELITNEQLYECVGIENSLSHEMAVHTVLAVNAHRDAIIAGQRFLTPEALSRVSINGSMSFRDRAQSVAAGNMEHLND